MASITKEIDVNVPVTTAYNQWTQFESFPQFMTGVKEVRQLDAKRLHWDAEIAGKGEQWDAEITEQIPDTRIAWRSVTGTPQGGAVDFHRVSDSSCQLTVTMDYEPQGLTEKVGSAFGFDDRQVAADLERFKEFIEARGSETGAYRGSSEGGAKSS
ncbi:MAG: SRPBCC family protein [Candidatus Dormibacteraceae bacterium]